MLSAVLAFSVAALLLALTPGADTALVLRATARGGRPGGFGAVAGISTGVTGWGIASAAGLSTVTATFPPAYQALRWGGAAYLVVLGVRSLLVRAPEPPPAPGTDLPSPDRGADVAPGPGAGAETGTGVVDVAGSGTGGGTGGRAAGRPGPGRSRPAVDGFRAGLLTNLLNPKVGVFYLAFLPQFVPPGAPVFALSVGLTAIHVTLGTLWLCGIVQLVDRARGVLGRPSVRRRLERVTGAVLVGFGVRLALAAR